MSYVERNLYENEWIVDRAQRDKWGLVGRWFLGVLFCWLLLIPLIIAIVKTVQFCHTELTVTNKRVVRKKGVFHIKAFDAPLDKIVNVRVEASFWGRIFNVYRVYIYTESGVIFDKIENGNEFKSTLLGEIDQFAESRLARQASWTAQALANNLAAAQQNEAPARKNPYMYY